MIMEHFRTADTGPRFKLKQALCLPLRVGYVCTSGFIGISAAMGRNAAMSWCVTFATDLICFLKPKMFMVAEVQQIFLVTFFFTNGVDNESPTHIADLPVPPQWASKQV